jgi:hypothetical protein
MSIYDELVHKVHKLHISLTDTQHLLSIVQKENICLKKLISQLSNSNEMLDKCIEVKDY